MPLDPGGEGPPHDDEPATHPPPAPGAEPPPSSDPGSQPPEGHEERGSVSYDVTTSIPGLGPVTLLGLDVGDDEETEAGGPDEPAPPFTPAEALAAGRELKRYLEHWHVEDARNPQEWVSFYEAQERSRRAFRDVVLGGEHGRRPEKMQYFMGLKPGGSDDDCVGSAFR